MMKILITSLLALFYASTEAMVLVDCKAQNSSTYQVLMLSENELTIQKNIDDRGNTLNEMSTQYQFNLSENSLVILAKLADQGFALFDLQETAEKLGRYNGFVTIESKNKKLQAKQEAVFCQRYFNQIIE